MMFIALLQQTNYINYKNTSMLATRLHDASENYCNYEIYNES